MLAVCGRDKRVGSSKRKSHQSRVSPIPITLSYRRHGHIEHVGRNVPSREPTPCAFASIGKAQDMDLVERAFFHGFTSASDQLPPPERDFV